MNVLELNSLSFSYEGEETNAIKDISLTVCEGDFCLVCGKSGSGKSTLLKVIKEEIRPKGCFSGEIKIYDSCDNAIDIGYVGQNPSGEIVTDKVWHEIAFALENLGLPSETIRMRVAEICHYLGIHKLSKRKTSTLSGGEKRLVMLASVLATYPKMILLDEPTSELDKDSCEMFLNALKKVNRELGISIIICEHDIAGLIDTCNKLVVLKEGVATCYSDIREGLLSLECDMPDSIAIAKLLGEYEDVPLTLYDTRDYLKNYAKEHTIYPVTWDRYAPNSSASVIMKDVWYGYEKGNDIICGLDLKVHGGEFIGLLGGNGCGKSTILKLIAGLFRPHTGKVKVQGTVAMLPQDPHTLFSETCVKGDLLEVTKDTVLIEEYVQKFDLGNILDKHPYDISGGELMRASIAKLLLRNADILLLDEPTKGLDDAMKEELARILIDLKANGVTVIMVSHDLEFAAKYTDRCALVYDGIIANVSDTREFFLNNSFYTTFSTRAARGILENVVTVDDIGKAFGKSVIIRKKDIKKDDRKPMEKKKITTKNVAPSMLSCIVFFLIVPLTIYVGAVHLMDKKYLFIAALIMIECMIPIYMNFEKKEAKSPLIVTIAVYCALIVVSRAMFYMLPEIKPVTALVVIAGAIFGADTGFFIGSTSMLVSNMYFGEGPWTPWQMFAMGLIGFVSGLLFRRRTNTFLVGVYGLLAAVVIYGGIMNPAAAIISGAYEGFKELIPYYISGFPIDVLRGVATFGFIILLYKPINEKLERVIIKYC